MVRICVSDVIDAPVEKVWGLTGGLNGMPKWHLFVRDGDIENGMPSDAIGCARHRVLRITEGNRTFIDWWAKFEVCAADPEHLKSPASIRVPYL